MHFLRIVCLCRWLSVLFKAIDSGGLRIQTVEEASIDIRQGEIPATKPESAPPPRGGEGEPRAAGTSIWSPRGRTDIDETGMQLPYQKQSD